MAKGWIRVHRQLQESEIWVVNQPFDYRSAWIDLLMLANHEDKTIIFDYKPMTIKRGQFLTSVRKLGERWKWGKERTLKFLRLLERLGMVTKDSTKRRTLITIENYGKFQDAEYSDEDTIEDTDRTLTGTQTEHCPATNNNVKNEKNNIYPSSFNEFWQNYPRKQDKAQAYKCYKARLNDGYTESQLLEACINYAAECDHDKREKKYIKVGSTFLSVNEPFVDYLDERNNQNHEQPKGRTNGNGLTDDEIEAILEYRESDEAKRENEDLWRDLPKV